MTSNSFRCHLCQADVDESIIKQHISGFHLNYRPYDCTTCNENGNSYMAVTEEAMEDHIAISHSWTNSASYLNGYHVIKNQIKEKELKAAIEECRRVSILQTSSTDTGINLHQNISFHRRADIDENVQVAPDSKEHLRRVFISLDDTSTDTGNISAGMKQENSETTQDVALETTRPEVEQNHNAPAIDQTLPKDMQDLTDCPALTNCQATLLTVFNQLSDINEEPTENQEVAPNIDFTRLIRTDSRKVNHRKNNASKIQSNTFAKHLRTHVGESSLKCNFFNYAAASHGNLIVHERTHSGEKPFKCRFCGYTAAQRGNLNRHIRSHTNEKPFKCQFCEYATAESGNLTKHVRSHTKEKPFKCHFCQFATAHRNSLSDHIRIHTTEKPYKCRFCEYAAAQSSSLIKHIRIHTTEKPYKCRFCEYASRYGQGLNLHMRKKHEDASTVHAANNKKNT